MSLFSRLQTSFWKPAWQGGADLAGKRSAVRAPAAPPLPAEPAVRPGTSRVSDAAVGGDGDGAGLGVRTAHTAPAGHAGRSVAPSWFVN